MNLRTGQAQVGPLSLCYEDMGHPDHPAVLLIAGLNCQLLSWPHQFCQLLVDQGFRVIRFDNRDVGLSTKYDNQSLPGLLPWKLMRFWCGWTNPALYTLEDFADDAIGVLDALEISHAHIVGASMGGMIAQILAARYPTRTRSLGILFSSNNHPFLPLPNPRMLYAILSSIPPESPVEEIIVGQMRSARTIGSPGYPVADEQLRQIVTEAYQRSYYPQGAQRHFAAMLASGDLTHYDHAIHVPCVVIHGMADKLIRPAAGKAIAQTIPHSRLVLFAGMAHDIPQPLWPQIVAELTTTFRESI